jgi:hypothetical protein
MMVNPMKCRTLAIPTLLFLLNPAWVLAEHPSVTDKQAEIVEPDKVSSTVEAGTNQAIPGKCKGGRMHGGGQHGKGGHGGGQHGKGGHDKHRQVVQRLDMIEARMAKIEAMLEILMRR